MCLVLSISLALSLPIAPEPPTLRASAHSLKDTLFEKDGVEVTLQGETQIITGAWTVAVVITPPAQPHIEPFISKLEDCISQSIDFDLQTNIELWGQRLLRVRELLTHPHPTQHIKPVETKYIKKRSKRGLLNFIGKISRTLFGTATEDQVNDLRRVVNRLVSHRSVLTHEVSDLISVVNASRHYIQLNADHLD